MIFICLQSRNNLDIKQKGITQTCISAYGPFILENTESNWIPPTNLDRVLHY